MKGRPVDQMVFDQIFSKGLRPSDPQNFHALLQRYLILEVRQEVHSFYGHLDTQEAKYPGLDYTHPTHRIRLGRWPWHRRLFRAFDALGLTHAEIASLTKWEGTKWAKERFEREQGIIIRDTTADCMGKWIEPEDRPDYNRRNRTTNARSRSVSRVSSQERETSVPTVFDESGLLVMPDDSEEELESVGEALNERLRLRVALRNASGDASMPLDEEWETWLKNAIESGELPHVTAQIVESSGADSTRASGSHPLRADDIFPARMLASARAGQWHEIPDFLHEMIRHSLEGDGVSETPSIPHVGAPDSSELSRTGSRAEPAVDSTRSLPSVEYLRSYNRAGGGSARLVAELIESRDHQRRTYSDQRTYSDLRLPISDRSNRARASPTAAAGIRVHRAAAQPGA